MIRSPLRRSLAAVITSLACLVLMANPAAATTHNATINSGVSIFTKPAVLNSIDYVPVAPCAAGWLVADDYVHGVTFNVPSLDWVGRVTTVTGGATTYLFHIFRTASTAGTLNTATGTITNMRLVLKMEIFTAPTTGCTLPTTGPLCSLSVQLNLSGTYTPAGTLSTGDVATLTGSSVGIVVASPTCTAGPTFLLGTTVTITTPDPLVFTLTT